MMGRWPSAVLAALVAFPACARQGPFESDLPAPRVGGAPVAGVGRLVIVGGALQASNAEVYQAILEGRQGDGPLCVVPTAGGDPAASMESAVSTLATYAGSPEVKGVLISTEDPSRAWAPSVEEDLRACSGFYFTGGVQSRVVDVFLPQGDTTPAYRALWDRWQEGAVIAGSSAGAAMMSGVMIASGGSAAAISHGLATQEDGEGVNIRSGMGLFTRAILDQHFLARGRIGRLLVAVLATDSLPVGLGIDENTALIVDGDSAVVAGASGVVVVDARQARREGAFRGTGIRVSLAGTGDVVDLTSFAVRRGVAKRPVPVRERALDLPADPFARWAFLHLVEGLAATRESAASFPVAGATLRISEAADFSAVMVGPGGVQGLPAGLSAGPFHVDLAR